MKESTNNYPNFYLLPIQAVSSLIEMGNVFIEENIKMTEEVFSTVFTQIKSSIQETKQEIPKEETPGEDMNFIHEKGENHKRTVMENHQAENIFQHQADVALHQENKKVMDARPSNKIFKRYNRSKGQK